MPSGVSPLLAWNFLTAFNVPLPKSPSAPYEPQLNPLWINKI
jgi:hypothetical protein